MHPLDIGLVVNRVARFVGGSHCSHHVSVLEFVSKGMRAHFNAKLRLEIHLLGILEYEYNRARASEEEESDSDSEEYYEEELSEEYSEYLWGEELTWVKQGPNKWEQEALPPTVAACRHWAGIPCMEEEDY